MTLYHGFSTHNRTKKFHVTDFDLVKQDIFNHFNIRKGEKLMNPEFGTIIWSLLFEPFTDDIRAAITEDVKRVVMNDPRVAVNSITVNEFGYGIQVLVELTYLTEDKTELLTINFNKDSK